MYKLNTAVLKPRGTLAIRPYGDTNNPANACASNRRLPDLHSVISSSASTIGSRVKSPRSFSHGGSRRKALWECGNRALCDFQALVGNDGKPVFWFSSFSTARHFYKALGKRLKPFTYTATGRRATMTDGSGTTTYGYDNLDRLTSKATPFGTLTYGYDVGGNVTSIQSSNTNGVWLTYTYDSLNRLATVVDNRLAAGQNTTTYAYDPASSVAAYSGASRSRFRGKPISVPG